MTDIKITPPEEPIVEIKHPGQMAQIVADWQQRTLAMLKHLSEMPEGTEIEQGDQTFTLEGDARAGYQLGLALAINELTLLPFEFINDEQADTNQEKQDTPALPEIVVAGG